MPSIIPGFEYDIFVSYRQKDNKYDGWVSDFVANLKRELEATFKEEISVYFDENLHDGLLETHNVDKSLEGKLKCLILVPIISQTYCDPKSFAWQHEFLVFNKIAKEDQFGREVKLSNGNVASRILPVKIHDINAEDKTLIENELGPLRSVDFILKSAGINRPLTSKDDEVRKHGQILYRDQINKVANALKEIVTGLEIREAKSTERLSSPIPHRSQSIEPNSKPSIKKILAICATLIFVVIAVYFMVNFTTIGAKFIPDTLDKSIAVLSFKNISDDKNDEYFSDGMTEEIINSLAKVGDLKVLSRTSIEQYKGESKDIKTIANELDVSYILDGSVRKEDHTFRISVQLIEAETGFILWTDEYNREITGVLQVQRDISTEVTEALKIILTPSEKENIENAPPVELTAYGLYLRARSELMNYRLTGQAKQEHLKNAISLFKNSLEGDPKFARTYSGLGQALIYKYFYVLHAGTTIIDSAKMLADKALELDDKTEEAHYVRSIYYFYGDVDKAIFECKRALEINPNYADALLKLGEMNNLKGDFVSGLSQMERAIQLGRGPELADNLHGISAAYGNIGLHDKSEQFSLSAFRLDKDSAQLFARKSKEERFNRNYQSALRFANKAYHLDSSNWYYVEDKAWLLSLLGRHQEALDTWLHSSGGRDNRIGYTYWVMGNKKKAYEYFNRTIERANAADRVTYLNYYDRYDLAGIYAFLGEKEKAYQYLEEVNLEEVNKDTFFPFWFISLIKEDPLFEKIRNEDHFKRIVQHMEDTNNAERNRVIQWLEKEKLKAKVERY